VVKIQYPKGWGRKAHLEPHRFDSEYVDTNKLHVRICTIKINRNPFIVEESILQLYIGNVYWYPTPFTVVPI
jgi:hypothetical protein